MMDYSNFEYYFPRRLEEILNERGFDGKYLEDLGVISQSSIRDYIDGKVFPNLRTAVKLADFLDVSLDYLCGIGEDGPWKCERSDISRKAPWL